jgi:hypothetical protein
MDMYSRFCMLCSFVGRGLNVGLIPCPGSSTTCPNRLISSEVKILNRNMPWMAYTLKDIVLK